MILARLHNRHDPPLSAPFFTAFRPFPSTLLPAVLLYWYGEKAISYFMSAQSSLYHAAQFIPTHLQLQKVHSVTSVVPLCSRRFYFVLNL